MASPSDADRPLTRAGLIGVLGVVYGDIGTGPLYALRESLVYFADDGLARWEILGLLSLIFWSLMLTVTIKYVLLVLRADNRGEGGILALMIFAQRHARTARGRWLLALVGIAGAALFFGEGIITPAISVLSAVEGLKLVSPAFEHLVIPITIGILLALFLVQWKGTGSMGLVFGPICIAWFGVLGLLGLIEVVKQPAVLAALSPHFAIVFCANYKLAALITFGAVVLAVTGAEALYADMGHFGRSPIRVAWTAFVLPALTLNYFGQGALILSEPEALENPFFLLAPEWFRLPLVVLATAATVIASQAMITGTFSVARQGVQLGLLPRLKVVHTSKTEHGQIYMPQVNTMLLIGVLIAVLLFKTSSALAAAYGLAVTGTFLCTSCLAFLVFRRAFRWPRLAVIAVFVPLWLLDAVFFVSTALKIPEGGYVPLLLGILLFVLMLVWKRAQGLLLARPHWYAPHDIVAALRGSWPGRGLSTLVLRCRDKLRLRLGLGA